MKAPQKSESPVAAGQFAKDQSTESSSDSAIAAEKHKASLQAAFARAGHAVHQLASGGYLVVAIRWGGLCREVPDLPALAAFARQMGLRT